ncbi:hypothetical protein, partial [Burkholderia ubonensis]|uniref:hypothetical protein n=1 Tax=Burkholderia ubonensis TaxID=101571 RepID=UPI001E2BB667
LDGNRRFHPSESGSAMQSYFWDGTLATTRFVKAILKCPRPGYLEMSGFTVGLAASFSSV